MRKLPFLLLLVVPVAPAAEKPHEHKHDAMSVDEFIARMEDPARAEWQKPEEVVKALGLRSGDRVLDLGAGPGYLTLPIAKTVGESGHVFAADIEPGMLKALIERMKKAGVSNITPVLVPPDDPALPAASVDLVFVCDTYHHLEDRGSYLGKLARVLRPGGRLAIVDFHKKELPVGPPMEMKIERDAVLKEVTGAGFRLASEMTFLPYQYGLVFVRP